MKQLFQKAVAALAIVLLISCSKEQATSPVTPPASTQTLTVSFSRNEINADGFDETVIRVKDKDNNDVTAGSSIYINNTLAGSTVFYTAIAGTYQVKAVRNNLESATATLNAVSPGPSLFTQKVLTEMFTGTWCGICPGTIIPLEDYIKNRPEIIYVGIHGPSGSGDPYQYVFDPQLRSAFGVGGVPTVLVNRKSNWDGKEASLDQLTKQRAPVGIAFESSISGNTISAKVKVKFDVSTSVPLKLVVVLVEDKLKYNQTNYGHFNLPNPIVNFNHQNVLRGAGTDIFGDLIPVDQQTKGNIWQKEITLAANGYDLANCRLVGYVIYGSNIPDRKGVLNAQIATAGQNKNFD
jgi:thiol-disulfide isomerase/thioredoxin